MVWKKYFFNYCNCFSIQKLQVTGQTDLKNNAGLMIRDLAIYNSIL